MCGPPPLRRSVTRGKHADRPDCAAVRVCAAQFYGGTERVVANLVSTFSDREVDA
jgi:hypothetical protein